MKKIFKNEIGITLISLIVTIVVLLILAGITIGMLDEENGIIGQAQDAKTGTEIDNEKEILDLSIVQAMRKDRYGNIRKANLDNELDISPGRENYKSSEIDDGISVTFTESGRMYLVDVDGNIEYLGTQEELLEKVIITADKESNTTPEFVQNVELTVKTYVPVENNDIALLYAWTESNEQEPTEEEYLVATLSGSNTKKITKVASTVTTKGNYYLWVKVIINEKETPETFGTYAIREFTTLKVCSSEDKSTSPFLGSDVVDENITRNAIKSITIEKTLEGYSAEDSNCWDVSEKQDDSILAKYTEEVIDGITYYNIKIGSDGKIPANPNSTNLFRYIGYNASFGVEINGLENLDTSYVTNMGRMFGNCNKVKNLEVREFNTDNVTNMWGMFVGCSSLTNLDLSNFKTNNVTSIGEMFYGCNNITSLDLSNFNTDKVTGGMTRMFRGCQSLTSLNVSSFNTSNVTNMGAMFCECKKLTSLDVSGFDTSEVTSMAEMFSGCNNLTNLDVSKFKTSNVTNMSYMFKSCGKVPILDVSKFNTNLVTNMVGMFLGCSSVTTLDVSKFNTSKITNMTNMFYGCSSVTSLDVSSFDTDEVTSMANMFYNCTSLTSLDLRNFNINSLTNSKDVFYAIPKTTYIYVGTEDIQNWVLEYTNRTTTEYIPIKSATEE